MLRTNSKKAKENIIKYIKENQYYYIEEETLANDTPETVNFSKLAKIIWSDFEIQANFKNNRILIPAEMDRFIDWSRGLGACGLFDYWLYRENENAIYFLKEILEETEEEANRYTNEEASLLLTKLIYRELKGAIK